MQFQGVVKNKKSIVEKTTKSKKEFGFGSLRVAVV